MSFRMLIWLLLSARPAWAHHTKNHMMLSEDAAQIIAATRKGSDGDWLWLIWVGVTGILLLGFVRWWHNRR